jgi:murein DD-endopeptidase MepM/ murein hydrolase activator NlpD
MVQLTFRFKTPVLLKDWVAFFAFLRRYARVRGYQRFAQFEVVKGWLVDLLYKKRGRYARPFLHFGTVGLIFVVITFGPLLFRNEDESQLDQESGSILASATAFSTDFYTAQAEEVRQYRGGEIIVHTVQEGETLSSIAERYGLQTSTILWENDLTEKSTLKPGQELRILPVDGVRHKVAKGETIYTIAKKYGLDDSEAQVIVDYPFNEFLNDETFELAIGQQLVVPQGVIIKEATVTPTRQPKVIFTADAGAVSATGSFIRPASGLVTQGYSFYHKAVDIANRGGGPILAADAGVVTVAGWVDNSGYGRRVMIDHGNGYVTLYAHLSAAQVQVGQRVNRGDVVGQMGSTGRSTGTHLHFEIRQGGVLLNPFSFI